MVFLAAILLAGFVVVSQAQTRIVPYPLAVGCRQTSNLLFPYPIRSVDRGSLDIAVQKAWGVENILQVKALKPNFPPTSLSVVTADGKLYSFRVFYEERPDSLNIQFSDKGLEGLRSNLRHIRSSKAGLVLEVTGLYTRERQLLIKIRLLNRSAIPFELAVLRVIIHDRRRARRTAIQEIPLEPVFTSDETPFLAAGQSQERVMSFPAFGLTDAQSCVVELADRDGGLTLRCRFGRKTLRKAMQLTGSL